MAEGLLRATAGDAVSVDSAGTEPGTLNPLAVRAMAELGIDISAQRPTNVDDLVDVEYDYVITLCDAAREACPTFPGAKRLLHWGLPDPALAEGPDEERIEAFRSIRNAIRERIEALLPALREQARG